MQVGTGRDLSLHIDSHSEFRDLSEIGMGHLGIAHDATDPHETNPHETNPHETDPHETDPHETDRARTGHDPSLRTDLIIKIKSLSELIGAYKTTSSKQIHQIQVPDGSHPYQSFCWQRSYHDRIIRNQSEYDGIAVYIDRNPFEWSEDKFYR